MKFGLVFLPGKLEQEIPPKKECRMEKQICLVPRLTGLGGMVSFQSKFIQGLQKRGFAVTFDPSDPKNYAILVIGGWRNLGALVKARQKGTKIFQRLNGMNWLHKVQKTPFSEWIYAEIANHLLAFIRRFVCHEIIYQSDFSKTWWNNKRGKLKKSNHIIYNGVDLDIYSPAGPETLPTDRFRILLVEGHLTDASAAGLTIACQMIANLQEKVPLPVELMIAGDVPLPLKETIKTKFPNINPIWLGVLPNNEIPSVNRSAHLLFSADLNAACPNSVIEALACGLPVLSYDTGALSEIVDEHSGIVVPYGSNYWKLETPDISALANAAQLILNKNNEYRKGARANAIKCFSLDDMVENYLEVLLK